MLGCENAGMEVLGMLGCWGLRVGARRGSLRLSGPLGVQEGPDRMNGTLHPSQRSCPIGVQLWEVLRAAGAQWARTVWRLTSVSMGGKIHHLGSSSPADDPNARKVRSQGPGTCQVGKMEKLLETEHGR